MLHWPLVVRQHKITAMWNTKLCVHSYTSHSFAFAALPDTAFSECDLLHGVGAGIHITDPKYLNNYHIADLFHKEIFIENH